ncbi:MAG: hypothetical protein K6U10_13735 [Acidobacteriia bacterium]|nr:hypothetical protein [Methyloceanibacter sp.]MCL6492862.1 hypothetical protein [Terriglobia bacterium]
MRYQVSRCFELMATGHEHARVTEEIRGAAANDFPQLLIDALLLRIRKSEGLGIRTLHLHKDRSIHGLARGLLRRGKACSGSALADFRGSGFPASAFDAL